MASCFGRGRDLMPRLALVLAAAVVLLAPLGADLQEEYEFVVISKQAESIRVAVPDFRLLSELAPGDDSAAVLASMMREAVEMTGLLTLISPQAYPSPLLRGPGEDLAPWKLIRAGLLIRGNVARADENRYRVELRCFDLAQDKMVAGKVYTGDKDLFNRMVMKFMDEVIGWLTGRKGALDSRIAYVSEVTGRNEIHVMDTDGAHDRALTGNHTLNLSPAWSPDGRYLLYLGYRARNPDLYVHDLVRGKEARFFSMPGLNLSGEFSRDGRMIAFAREGSDGNIDVYIINIRGKSLTRMTSDPGSDISPTWSPDGKFIAFTSDRSGTNQVYLLDMTRGAEGPNNPAVRLTSQGSYNTDPAWSPDGRYIAYEGRVHGQFDLFLIDISGRHRPTRRLTATPANEEHPAWSPDSRFVVYDSNKYGNYDIYVMSIYGGSPRRITSGAVRQYMPAWSPRVQP